MKWFRVESDGKTDAQNLGVLGYNASGAKPPFPFISLFPFGIISKPPQNLQGVETEVGANGNKCIVGYVSADGGELSAGETAVFSTDENGEKQAVIILRKNGDIEISKANKIMITGADDVEISGANVEITGDSDVKIQNKDFLTHTHQITQAITAVAGQATGTATPFESQGVS